MNGPLATYEALLKIFVDAEENDCAEVLCKLLVAGMDVLCVCLCVCLCMCVCVHVCACVCVHAFVCALLETESYYGRFTADNSARARTHSCAGV